MENHPPPFDYHLVDGVKDDSPDIPGTSAAPDDLHQLEMTIKHHHLGAGSVNLKMRAILIQIGWYKEEMAGAIEASAEGRVALIDGGRLHHCKIHRSRQSVWQRWEAAEENKGKNALVNICA